MRKNSKYLKIINKIENFRKNNNKNWMDILRLSMKHSPAETKKLLKKINIIDKKISAELKNMSKLR